MTDHSNPDILENVSTLKKHIDGLRSDVLANNIQINLSASTPKIVNLNTPTSDLLGIKPVDKGQLEAFKLRLSQKNDQNNQQNSGLQTQTETNVIISQADQEIKTNSEALKLAESLVSTDYPEFSLVDYGGQFQTKELPLQPSLVELDQINFKPDHLKLKKLETIDETKVSKKRFTKFVWNPFLVGSVSFLLIAFMVVSLKTNLQISDSTKRSARADQLEFQEDINLELTQYKSWLYNYNSGLDPGDAANDYSADIDLDGLSNYEEFLIGSNPTTAYSCNPKITDAQNLVNLINPVNCKAINLENPLVANVFYKLIPTLNPQINFGSASTQVLMSSLSSISADSNSNSKVEIVPQEPVSSISSLSPPDTPTEQLQTSLDLNKDSKFVKLSAEITGGIISTFSVASRVVTDLVPQN